MVGNNFMKKNLYLYMFDKFSFNKIYLTKNNTFEMSAILKRK